MRNVVLLCLDSVRKDVFDVYAHRLRSRADWAFEQCRAASSWSIPSHASMMTGQLPHEHGVHAYNRSYAGLERRNTLLGELPMHTALGVSTNVFAGEAFEFDAIFDSYRTLSTATRYADGLDPAAFTGSATERNHHGEFFSAAVTSGHPLKSLANGGLGLLKSASTGRRFTAPLDDGAKATVSACKSLLRTAEEPFFLFSNLMEAHTPLQHVSGYDRSLHVAEPAFTTEQRTVWELMPTGPRASETDAIDSDAHTETAYLRSWRSLYGAAVDYLDRVVCGLCEWLQANTSSETTVVVTADHGENLGFACEHGLVRHKSSLSEGLLHVPLLVLNAPGDRTSPSGQPVRVQEYLSHLELPTLLAALGADVPLEESPIPTGPPPEQRSTEQPTESQAPVRAQSCAELIGMSAGPEPPENEAEWNRAIRCVYDGTRKYCWDTTGRVERYELDGARANWQRQTESHQISSGNVEADLPAWALAAFEEPLGSFVEAARTDASTETTDSPAGVSESTHHRLEQLGYR